MNIRVRAAKFEGWTSIVVNILLFALKYWAGIVSGSLALIADAWHTLSDSITSIVVLISSHISAKPADKEHPYGHGRAEVIASVIIGVLMCVVSVEFLREAFVRFQEQRPAMFGVTALVVTGLSVIFKEALAEYALYLGKKHDMMSLEADGYHHRSDALSSVAVLAGIFFSSRFWWIDSALSVIVAIMIGKAAVDILRRSANTLLGRRSEENVIEQVEKVCEEIENNLDVRLTPHHYHEHRYGQHTELTFHVFLPGKWSIAHGHEIIDEIEEKLRQRYHIEATIHIDPGKSGDMSRES